MFLILSCRIFFKGKLVLTHYKDDLTATVVCLEIVLIFNLKKHISLVRLKCVRAID